jgi:hypothetical protein
MVPRKLHLLGASQRLSHSLAANTIFLDAVEGAESAAAQTVLPSSDKPLVCLLGWIGVKEKALRKYASLYTERGVDCLCLLSKPQHVVLPRTRGRPMAGRIAEALAASGSRPLLVHGFSIGAYMYGNLLLELSERGSEGAEPS